LRWWLMHLSGRNGMALELRVVGYQFPDAPNPEYDSNWLVVEGRVSHPQGAWSFRDPCLLTYEASHLADWLEAVAAGREEQPGAGFIEPNLSFEVVAAGGERALRVSFAIEAHPPWSPRSQAAYIEFPVGELNIAGAVNVWRKQLRQFPQRAER
jgi:hypothetical protein